MSTCLICPLVRNREGKLIQSPLYRKLKDTFDNREMANIFYKIATSKEFLQKAKQNNWLVYNDDVPSELTFDCFVEITGLSGSEKIQEKKNDLNSSYSKNDISYEEALNTCRDFNSKNDYNKLFLCVCAKSENNQNLYNTFVIDRTSKSEEEFVKFIKNENILNQILYSMSIIGYKITKEDAKYIFTNPDNSLATLEVAIDDLDVNKTTEGVLKELCKIVYRIEKVTGNNKQLIDRAITVINKNRKSGEEGDAETDFVEMVADAIKGRLHQHSILERAANKLKDAVLTLYELFKDSPIRTARKDAAIITEQYFSNYIDVKRNVLDYVENKSESPMSLLLTKMKTEVHNLVRTFNKTGDKEAERRIRDTFIKNRMDNMLTYNGKISKIIFSEYVYDLTDGFSVYIEGLWNKIRDIDTNDKGKFNNAESQVEIAKLIYEARCVYDSFCVLDDYFDAIIGSYSKEHLDLIPDENVKKILKKYNETKEHIKDFGSTINNLEVVCFANFLSSIYGSDFITARSGIYLKRKEKKRKGVRGQETKIGYGFVKYKPQYKDPNNPYYTIKEIINGEIPEANEEIGFFRNWIGTMYDSTDPAARLIDFANKQVEDQINAETEKEMHDFIEIIKKLDSVRNFGKSKHYLLFERGENGIPTGNYISEYNQYLFKKDERDEIKRLKDEWGKNFIKRLTEEGRTYEETSKNERESDWEVYREDNMIKFYEEEKIVDGEVVTRGKKIIKKLDDGLEIPIYVAGDWYLNKDYKDLCDKYEGIEKPLKELIDFKYRQDLKLNGYGAPMYRAPQIDSYTTNMLANSIRFGKVGYLWTAFRRKIFSILNVTLDDLDWGSDINNVDIKADIYNVEPEIYTDNSEINTLVIYGVKEISDHKLLSTDIIHGMIAYINMATSYKHKNILMSTLNSGENVLKRRKITKLDRFDKNDKPIYTTVPSSNKNIDNIHSYITHNILSRKINAKPTKLVLLSIRLAQFGTFMALASNDITAAVNLGTGITDVLREGISTGKYNLSDFFNALFKSGIGYVEKGAKKIAGASKENVLGNEITNGFIDAFSRRFNVQNKNRVIYKNIKGDRNYFASAFGNFTDIFFAAFELGDSIMRVLPTISMMSNIKLLPLQEGLKPISMFNLYKQASNGAIYHQSLNIDDSLVLENAIKILREFIDSKSLGEPAWPDNNLYNEVFKKYEININENSENNDYYGILQAIERAKENLDTFFIIDDGRDASKDRATYIKLNEIKKKLYEVKDGTESFKNIIKENNKFLVSLNIMNALTSNKEKILDDIEDKKEELIYDIKDESKVLTDIKSMLTYFHGVYDDIDMIRLQTLLVGNLILGMKGYFLGYVARSFWGYNKWTGKEGMLATLMKATLFYLGGSGAVYDEVTGKKNIGSSFFKGLKVLISPIYRDKIIEEMMADGFSREQAYNSTRAITEYFIITAEQLIRCMLKSSIASLGGDDDDKKRKLKDWEERIIQEEKNKKYIQLYIIERLLYERVGYTAYPKFMFNLLAKKFGLDTDEDFGIKSMYNEFQSITNLVPPGFSVLFRTYGNLRDLIICSIYSDAIENLKKNKRGMPIDLFNKNGTINQKNRAIIKKNLEELLKEYPNLKGKIYEKNDYIGKHYIGDVKYKSKITKNLPIPGVRTYNAILNAEETEKSWMYYNKLNK